MKMFVHNGFYFIREDTSDLENELLSYDDEEVEIGLKIEKEHDDDGELDVVKSRDDLIKIVLAHLREDPEYYTKLKNMEEE